MTAATSWPIPDEELLRLVADGQSPAAIAGHFGIERKLIHGALKRARERAANAALKKHLQSRRCPICTKPHLSTGPGDRYHPNCRSIARDRDDGLSIYL